MSRRKFILGMSALTLLTAQTGRRVCASPADFATWPRGRSPDEIGARVAARYLPTQMPVPIWMDGALQRRKHISYWESCTWYGALTFAQMAQDEALKKKLTVRIEPLFGPETNLVTRGTPDQIESFHGAPLFGIVPFELYLQTGDARYLDMGLTLADRQWAPPTAEWLASPDPEKPGRPGRKVIEEALEEGLSWQTRHWVDDVYLIVMLQVQAYRATGQRVYIDRATREMCAHLDSLQLPNGLFHHRPGAPFYWGRGNGWAAAGMAELLRSMPTDHPDRPRVLAAYRKMMAALLEYQDENGMWRQLIDYPEAWPETSSTGMFVFAFLTGVENGWLAHEPYAKAARKGWMGLTAYINTDGDISEVCEGSNSSEDHRYYLNRRRNIGDLHGQAPVLWCATALLRLEKALA